MCVKIFEMFAWVDHMNALMPFIEDVIMNPDFLVGFLLTASG
jgi:hypothetical protein